MHYSTPVKDMRMSEHRSTEDADTPVIAMAEYAYLVRDPMGANISPEFRTRAEAQAFALEQPGVELDDDMFLSYAYVIEVRRDYRASNLKAIREEIGKAEQALRSRG